jgi:hypothetical protein
MEEKERRNHDGAEFSIIVIASEAKQSRIVRDPWIASSG